MKYKSTLAVVIIFMGVLFLTPLCSNLSAVHAEITVDDPNGDGGTSDTTPADETPADEAPADEAPADETPADEAPADEAPADETPADETPADTTPIDTTSGDAQSDTPEPVADTPAEPPATNDSTSDTTQPEDATTDEPAPAETAPEEPAMTKDEAIEEAKNQLVEPPPVFDLTNPGIVYGMLSEGVAAWKATLEGNTNEFGVEIGGAVVSSTRPDVVPASLQTFLLGFYQDSAEVGLAFGPDGVAVAVQQLADAYNQSVLDLADKMIEEDGGSVIEDSADDDENDSNNNEPDVNDSLETTVPESDDNSTVSEDVPEMTDADNGLTDTQAKVEVIYFSSDT